MIHHIGRFAFQDDLPEDEREQVVQRLQGLADLESTTASLVCQDIGGEAAGFTHVSIVLIAGEDEYAAFHADPAHAEAIEYVIPRLKKLMACDAAEDMDPGLAGRMEKAQEDGVEMSPAAVSHLGQILA